MGGGASFPAWALDGQMGSYHAPKDVSKGGKLATFAAGSLALGVFLWRRWGLFAVAVDGESMRPILAPGDWLLVSARPRPRRGALVVVEHPLRPGVEMVKRLGHVPGDAVGPVVLADDEYWLEGADPETSTDSRSLGPFSGRLLRGVVLVRYRPLRRARLFW
jgi:nickel-type superoxide dismutase maturation protease